MHSNSLFTNGKRTNPTKNQEVTDVKDTKASTRSPALAVDFCPIFQQLIDFVKESKPTQFDKLLGENPLLLDEVTPSGENIAHIIAKEARSPVFFSWLHRYLQQHNRSKLLVAKNKAGWLPIHFVTKHNTVAMLKTLISIMDEVSLHDAIMTVTNEGQNCLDLAGNFVHWRVILEIHALVNTVGLPNKTLNPNDVLLRYGKKANKRLIQNLLIGCIVADQVAGLNIHSSTHPFFKKHDPKFQSKLSKDVTTLRNELDEEWDNIDLEYNKITNPSLDDAAKRTQAKLNLNMDLIKKYQAANCQEKARAALKFLKALFPEIRGEGVFYGNSDHFFIVIDRDPASDINDYSKWGNSAVVVDSWAMEVFPASDIPQRLSYFYWYSDINLDQQPAVGPVNTIFHKFEIDLVVESEPASQDLHPSLRLIA